MARTEREIDEVSQVETTGHEWDGIRELNTPMPRWWLWTFYATIVWGVVWVVLFPAVPLINRATGGVLGFSTRENVAEAMAVARAANAPLEARLMQTDFAAVEHDPELLRYAIAGGGAVFRNYCSQCHGAGAAGAAGGYPNLLDDDWLWGGSAEAIHQTITHGIRYEPDADTRFSEMPAFGDILSDDEIDGLVRHVLSLSGGAADAESTEAHAQTFLDNCAACHGEDGTGSQELGAPDLTDEIWLYGSSPEQVRTQIVRGRNGVMPAFAGRLSDSDRRKVALWVHNLGGGQ